VARIPVRLHPKAEEEANSAWAWYADRNPRAADAFFAELDAAMAGIAEGPLQWPRLYGRYRRFPMHTFPFNVVYIQLQGIVEVIAIAHFRRRPGYWRQRTPLSL